MSLDSDYAKRKLPEYNRDGGATLVHEESDAIIFTSDFNLLEYSSAMEYNLVIPRVGSKISGIIKLANKLKEKGYIINLILVDLDRLIATRRAYSRYVESGRYVPLALIFDEYANDPILNYYRCKQRHSDLFQGFAQVNTNVEIGRRPIIEESINLEIINRIFS